MIRIYSLMMPDTSSAFILTPAHFRNIRNLFAEPTNNAFPLEAPVENNLHAFLTRNPWAKKRFADEDDHIRLPRSKSDTLILAVLHVVYSTATDAGNQLAGLQLAETLSRMEENPPPAQLDGAAFSIILPLLRQTSAALNDASMSDDTIARDADLANRQARGLHLQQISLAIRAAIKTDNHIRPAFPWKYMDKTVFDELVIRVREIEQSNDPKLRIALTQGINNDVLEYVLEKFPVSNKERTFWIDNKSNTSMQNYRLHVAYEEAIQTLSGIQSILTSHERGGGGGGAKAEQRQFGL